ncbi:FAD-dependent oxidoreductase [Schaalia sp. Marseille-Q2122]|uniref:FAD-dependent oxidoreductase n=1 Tax=Schaalia sp. Marseille-Q2122 TaxID=2736604 RepID=UPI00158EA019|nr:FAD-dependent oxidoreductase [Schaalia sp. Marseille-Q2122]
MHFDVVILGWGKAGKSLAADLARQGQRVALVERSSSMYGGTCINVGCVPTKDLVTSAEERRQSDDPAQYFAAAVAERDTLISALRAANYAMLDGKVALFDGQASFVDPHTVRVSPVEPDHGGEELDITADTIVINTGTIPRALEIPGADLSGVYDSTTIQHAKPFPSRLLIVGAGFIGLEFASMFANFGAQVTVTDPGEVFIRRVDRDVATSVEESLTAAGVQIRMNTAVESISQDGSALRVHTSEGDIETDAVLIAVGRVPATAELNLEAAGVDCDERGFVRVDDQLRTSVEHIFAVGDVNGGPQFTYISYDDYRIVRDVLIGEGRRNRQDRVAVPWTAFIDPPLSVVGISEAEALKAGVRVAVASAPVAKIPVMPRPKILGKTAGMMKFIVDADSNAILGAALHSVDSQELINIVALCMRMGGTVADLRDGIWTHPSSTEAFNGVLRGLQPVTD